MRLFLRPFPALGGLPLFALLCAAAVGADGLHAGTLTVTSAADSGTGSLRVALAAASDGDSIQFDAALNGQAITLTSGELVIDDNIFISGPGPRTLAVVRDQQASAFRIFHVMAGYTVTIQGLRISGGAADASVGGGIFNDNATLRIINSTVTSNIANVNGGGIYNSGTHTIAHSTVTGNQALISGFPVAIGGGISNGGTLEISNSSISGNMAGINAGGISNGGLLTITDTTVSGNSAGINGGGIDNHGGGSATLNIYNSTISGNTANQDGGGIANDRPLTIINSTVSGNTANRDGGGISNFGTLTIIESTVSGNSGNRDGGGIINRAGLEIENTILEAGASGANIFNSGGTIASLGYNLSSDDGGGFLTASGDQINTDPMLGPLQNNGGPTFTHGLLTGSPALDAGDPNFTPPPLHDQRGPGYHRVFNGRIDIGSMEVQPAPTPTPTASPPPPSPAQALNISTRLRVETGNNVLIGGFIVTGNVPKNVAVRGIGPSLAAAGISDFLADPTLELRAANGVLLAQNDDWQDDPAQAAQLMALGLALQHPNESGLVATLQPGASYTAILAGNNSGTGIGLVEIYDANPAADSQLANISTRGFVQAGNNVMIGGFILGRRYQQHPGGGARGRSVAGPDWTQPRAGRSDPGAARCQWRSVDLKRRLAGRSRLSLAASFPRSRSPGPERVRNLRITAAGRLHRHPGWKQRRHRNRTGRDL